MPKPTAEPAAVGRPAIAGGEFRHFADVEAILRLNHGSYGACTADVLEAQAKLRSEWLQSPDHFFESRHPALIDAATAAVRCLVGASDPTAGELGLVENTTMAASVRKSRRRHVYLSHGSISNACVGCSAEEGHLLFPCSAHA